MSSDGKILLIYDGDCPACSYYASIARVRESVGELELVDARQQDEAVDLVTAAGLDLDEGMVLKIGDQLHYGADAIHMLALIGGGSGAFNRLAYWCFRSPRRARLTYPVLRAGRNLLLRVLGRSRIDNLRRHGHHHAHDRARRSEADSE